jgi:hypothetical protein
MQRITSHQIKWLWKPWLSSVIIIICYFIIIIIIIIIITPTERLTKIKFRFHRKYSQMRSMQC